MGLKDEGNILAVVLFSIRLIIRECKAVNHKAGAESEMTKRTYLVADSFLALQNKESILTGHQILRELSLGNTGLS